MEREREQHVIFFAEKPFSVGLALGWNPQDVANLFIQQTSVRIDESDLYSDLDENETPISFLLEMARNDPSRNIHYRLLEKHVRYNQYMADHPNVKKAMESTPRRMVSIKEKNEWDEDIESSGYLENAERQGEWIETFLFPNNKDQTYAAGSYQKGQKSGEWVFYNKEGSIESMGDFTQGRRVGSWMVRLYRNAVYTMHGLFENGKRQGEWVIIDENGNRLKTVMYNQDQLIEPENEKQTTYAKITREIGPDEFLRKYNRSLVRVQGDGNCLFEAVLDQLRRTAGENNWSTKRTTVQDLREMARLEILAHAEEYQLKIVEGVHEAQTIMERGLELLQTPGTWTVISSETGLEDEEFAQFFDLVLVALGKALKRTIVLLNPLFDGPEEFESLSPEGREKPALILYYNGFSHYDSTKEL